MNMTRTKPPVGTVTEKTIANKDDKVWVTVTYTVNLGNYENIKIEAGLSQTLLPKEDSFDLLNSLSNTLLDSIIDQGEEIRKEMVTKKQK